MKLNIRPLYILTLCAVISMNACSTSPAKHAPRDLQFWSQAGKGVDWSKAAAEGDAKAQFYSGMELVRPHLQTVDDRVPGFSAVPLVGPRLFQNRSYCIGPSMNRRQMVEAQRWITLSADQGFAPAQEAKKLF